MTIREIESLPLTPWNNGGGVTREVASDRNEKGMIWRLSFAEVERPGPFSPFPGLARVLTVISGAGLVLRSDDDELTAAPGAPVRFSGDLPIDCVVIDGPVRDFNLIFDPARVNMDVIRIDNSSHKAKMRAAFPLTASCAIDGVGKLNPGSIWVEEGEAKSRHLSADGQTLIVTEV